MAKLDKNAEPLIEKDQEFVKKYTIKLLEFKISELEAEKARLTQRLAEINELLEA